MRPFVSIAPQAEPPIHTAAVPPIHTAAVQATDAIAVPAPIPPGPAPASSDPDPRCGGRPDLRAARRMPHRAQTPRHRAASGCDRAPATPAASDPDCRRFTEFALRSVLEALDRRRHLSGLVPLLAPTPLDLVAALVRAGTPGRRLGPAALRRVHIHSLGPGRAEVFGSYERGDRTFAIAGRVEYVQAAPTRPAPSRSRHTPAARGRVSAGGWLVTSLQVG